MMKMMIIMVMTTTLKMHDNGNDDIIFQILSDKPSYNIPILSNNI